MATLILTAVGSAVGGPIGGAIGAIIGQQADAAIFAPKPRHGPRLGDLSVQTSSYGTQIPKIFGTMRVAGTVIWATDLKEDKTKSGGGKGRPKTVSYSYSASFAVALSGRPVRAVRRIWADGKLLRGSAGDFKSETGFRLHSGGEAQAADPLIASVEGAGKAPAHRGIAYAVFEDFQLADYGNRIPSLTFEVEAESTPVTIGTIGQELSGGEIARGESLTLLGYAASGDSVRGAIESLGDILPLSLSEGEDVLRLESSRALPPIAVGNLDQGSRSERGSGGRSEIVRRSAGGIPSEVTIAYYDLDRHYQTGLQRATRGGPALRSDRRALAAVLEAGAAKSLAEQRLAWLWAGRETGKIHLPWRRSGIKAGAHLQIDGFPGLWKVARWSFDRMILTLEVVRVPSTQSANGATASPGRAVVQPDAPHGPTTLIILDLPHIGDGLAMRPQLFAAAAGVEAGWRRASLVSSYDGGASWQAEGSTAAPAVMGQAATALAPGGSALIDARSSVEVELLNEAMWLEDRADGALVMGANLAVIGNELIQFGKAEPLGNRRFLLSRLVRGRLGSEWAASGHSAGEAFLMLDRESLAVMEPHSGALGASLKVTAVGIGDPAEGATVTAPIEGRAVQPPSPVHLRAMRAPSGDLHIAWVRRSRSGWGWLSGSDTPLAEEKETYRLSLSGAGVERTVELSSPDYIYTAAQQGEDGNTGSLTIRVVQLGTSASSPAARLHIEA